MTAILYYIQYVNEFAITTLKHLKIKSILIAYRSTL